MKSVRSWSIMSYRIEDLEVINDEALLLSVEDNGVVEWEPTMIFSVHCDVSISILRLSRMKSVEDDGVVEWEPTIIFSVQCDVIACPRSLDTFMRT